MPARAAAIAARPEQGPKGADTMKTIGKILGGLIGLVVVAGAVFYFGWLRAPSPEAVCGHLADLAKQSGDDTSFDDTAACEDGLKPPEYGRLNYAKQMKCMMSASSLDAALSCGG
jgi:hypothetical protein